MRLSSSIVVRTLASLAIPAVAVLGSSTSYAGIVTSGGVSVDFEPVGDPVDAMRIAACSPTKIYAMNEDHSLWVSTNQGRDGTWAYVGTPGGADFIACDGETLIAMNYDHSIWRNIGGNNWDYFASAGGAQALGGGPGVLTAINYDQSFWTSVGNDSTTFPGSSWTERGVTGGAARITGSILNNQGRFFAQNYDGSLWLDDNVTTGSNNWTNFASGLPAGTVPAEITAGSSDMFYILDNTHRLWTAEVAESSLVGTKVGITSSQTGNVTATVSLSMSSAGQVTFEPRTTNTFQESGYMYNISCALEDAAGHTYTMQFSGHVNPAPVCIFCSDSSTDVPTTIGTVENTAVEANWRAINQNWTPSLATNMSCVLDAQETLTTGTILGDIATAVGLVAGVVSDPVVGVIAVVGAVIQGATTH